MGESWIGRSGWSKDADADRPGGQGYCSLASCSRFARSNLASHSCALRLVEIRILGADLHLEAISDQHAGALFADVDHRVALQFHRRGLVILGRLGVADRVEDRQGGDLVAPLLQDGLGEAGLLLGVDDVEVPLRLGEHLVELAAGDRLTSDRRLVAPRLLLHLSHRVGSR